MASELTGKANAIAPQVPESTEPSDANSSKQNAFNSNTSEERALTSFSDDALCAECLNAFCECLVLPEYIYSGLTASTVGNTLANKKCPSCRLIAHCITSLAGAQSISPESQISLWSNPYSFHQRPGYEGKYTKMASPRCFQVHLCKHKVKKGEENRIRKCETIGVLSPVLKGEFGDRTVLDSNKALFSTLAYQGSVFARPITRTVDVRLLTTWKDFCTNSHDSCKTIKTQKDINTKIRLIDVSERRLVDANLDEEYIALSYVWGSGKRVLTKSNLSSLYETGSLSSSIIPRLFADVMDFATEVGERYLWVDTACIIQDDDGDKQRQLPIMPSIYTQAKITIAAAVKSANDPLPRWNNCKHGMALPTEMIEGLAYTIGVRPLTAALAHTTWNRRGWTFQEGLLARRLLIFTADQIYWSCREESWREDQYTEFQNVKNNPTPHTSLTATHALDHGCDQASSMTIVLCSMGLYAKHVQTYSQRLFTDCSDVVWAFLGVLEATKQHFPNGYIWGLPYDYLDAALLWETGYERTQYAEHQYDSSPESRLPIPSWCWMGKGHKVWFEKGICETKSRVTWHKPVSCLSSHISEIDDNHGLARHPQAAVLPGSQSITKETVVYDYAFLHFTAQTTLLSIELQSDPNNLETFSTYTRKEHADLRCYPLVTANISLPSKRAIGQISVPTYVFKEGTRQLKEFALLSGYTGHIHSQFSDQDMCQNERNSSENSFNHEQSEDDTGGPYQKEEAYGYEPDLTKETINAIQTEIPEEHSEGCSHQPGVNVMLIEWDKTHKLKNFARRVAIARIDPSAWGEVVTEKKTIILG